MTPRQRKAAEVGVAYARLLNPDLPGLDWVVVSGRQTVSEQEECWLTQGAHIWAKVVVDGLRWKNIEETFRETAERIATRPRNP